MEKKKVTASDAGQESDKQFLERLGVNVQIKEVLTKLIENRPEDPIIFLADYFETLGDQVDRVGKAHQQICLTHHSKPAFQNNVRHAYEILGHSRLPERRGKKKETVTKTVKGFSGAIYTELLHLLCKEFPPTVRERLFKKIRCRDYEVVLFDIFKSGVFTCLVLKDFMEQAEHLYRLFDTETVDKADKLMCETLIQHFQDAINKTSCDPLSVLEAGYMLSRDKVYSALGSAMFKSSANANKGNTTCEEFVVGMADCFLLKVHSLK